MRGKAQVTLEAEFHEPLSSACWAELLWGRRKRIFHDSQQFLIGFTAPALVTCRVHCAAIKSDVMLQKEKNWHERKNVMNFPSFRFDFMLPQGAQPDVYIDFASLLSALQSMADIRNFIFNHELSKDRTPDMFDVRVRRKHQNLCLIFALSIFISSSDKFSHICLH